MYIGAVAVLPTYVNSRLLFSVGRAASDVDACPIFFFIPQAARRQQERKAGAARGEKRRQIGRAHV